MNQYTRGVTKPSFPTVLAHFPNGSKAADTMLHLIDSNSSVSHYWLRILLDADLIFVDTHLSVSCF